MGGDVFSSPGTLSIDRSWHTLQTLIIQLLARKKIWFAVSEELLPIPSSFCREL